MEIIFFQDGTDPFRRLCMTEPFGSAFMQWIGQRGSFDGTPVYSLLPHTWLKRNPCLEQDSSFAYQGTVWEAGGNGIPPASGKDPVRLLNGRNLPTFESQTLDRMLACLSWDIAFIDISPDLQPSREQLKLTSQHQVVGFRRFYTAAAEPGEQPNDWPPLTIFSADAWGRMTREGRFPLDFQAFLDDVRQQRLNTMTVTAGGRIRPLDGAGLLHCLDAFIPNGQAGAAPRGAIGPVWMGREVTIEPNVTLVGPVILSDGVCLKAGSVVRRSILGEKITVEKQQVINNQVWLDGSDIADTKINPLTASPVQTDAALQEFRHWPRFSYVRFGKRIFDILTASLVLMMLIPVFPIVMLMIKLTSPGPVFYKARRQGLHGKEFDCLKFRTMMLKADSIQERLRVVNQVDGPQFKIDNDPRISGVGKFLRDTCIDELPQFINVLLGQMSVVGPRPSPENENDSCPMWRDARLSVRPGITGLWQVCRTRKAGSDFQEWVYYDTRYVRNLSFRKDLWICWKTAKKLIKEFLGQFG